MYIQPLDFALQDATLIKYANIFNRFMYYCIRAIIKKIKILITFTFL
jgi:hypothetical protein